jgi:hypothetical protein
MVTEADFQRARRNEDPEFRQWFLNDIDLEDVKRYVKKVFYADFLSGGVSMTTFPNVLSCFHIPWMRASIGVYPLAFSCDYHQNLDDFLGTLIDHEGHHAMEFYLSPSIIPFYFPSLMPKKDRFLKSEQRAWENEQRAIDHNKRNFSENYRKYVEETVRMFYMDPKGVIALIRARKRLNP